jgi:hypothetical protein
MNKYVVITSSFYHKGRFNKTLGSKVTTKIVSYIMYLTILPVYFENVLTAGEHNGNM